MLDNDSEETENDALETSLHVDEELYSEISYEESSSECNENIIELKTNIGYDPLKKFEKYQELRNTLKEEDK